MTANRETERAGEANADVGGHVGRVLEAAVTQPPGWQELAWDAVLVGAALVRADPPAAIAGAAVNRLIHAA
jgi:hypothetical protein